MKPLHLCFITLFVVVACTSKNADKNNKESSTETKKTIALACTGETVEIPRGEEINRFKDKYDDEHVLQFSLEQDSVYLFEWVLSKDIPNEYLLVDVSAFAYTDINPSPKDGVYTSEYDVELTDGTKQKQTVFFIRSKNEERIFSQRTYTCFNEDTHFEPNTLVASNIACSSIDVAKKCVASLLAKLPKQ